eukprot:1160777-Pelagomonas_calceolata.AAC.17
MERKDARFAQRKGKKRRLLCTKGKEGKDARSAQGLAKRKKKEDYASQKRPRALRRRAGELESLPPNIPP